jgi:GT2 family glycosyltransferase
VKNNPLVSIVITSFNRLDDLRECIERLKDITYSNLEIIVVDGGSTDGSEKYISELKNENLKPLLLGIDKGNCFTTNEGMRNSNGKYVVIIDDDAFLSPSVINKTVEIFERNKNLGAIGYGLVNPINGINDKEYFNDYNNYEVKDNQFNNSYETMIYGSASAYRKSVLEDIGYFDLSWDWNTGGEDTELNFKIIANGYNSVVLPELVAYHKISSSTRQSRNFTANCITSTIWIILKFYPNRIMYLKLIELINKSLYHSIYFMDTIYIIAFYRSMFRAYEMYKYPKKLQFIIAKKVHIPIEWLFSHDRKKESIS